MMTFIPIAASVISFIEAPRRNEVCSWNATVWRIFLFADERGGVWSRGISLFMPEALGFRAV